MSDQSQRDQQQNEAFQYQEPTDLLSASQKKLKIKKNINQGSIILNKDQIKGQTEVDEDPVNLNDDFEDRNRNLTASNLSPQMLKIIKKKSDNSKIYKTFQLEMGDQAQDLQLNQNRTTTGNKMQLQVPDVSNNQQSKFSREQQIPVRPSIESNIFDIKMSSQPISIASIMKQPDEPNEEELKKEEEEKQRIHEEEEKLKDEKQNFKLADYFVTVGIDDFYTREEQIEEGIFEEETKQDQITIKPELNFYDKEDDFDLVVSKLEIYVIKDNSIFDEGYLINGVQANITHPDNLNSPNEKWIDLKGDKFIYLKVTYDNIQNCRKPITDLNFYKISRFKQQPDKMMIKVKQNIEPLPVKEFGDPEADKKYKKTKKLAKKDAQGQHDDDMYNFYGNYDLTSYLEETDQLDQTMNMKNLCLCQTMKKHAMPIQDIELVIGDRENQKINWNIREGYKGLDYSVGINGDLNRLLCKKNRDVMKRKLNAKVIDRYPPEGQDRHYYPFPGNFSEFCFPSGILMKSDYGPPEYFNFILTDQDGNHIYCTCLIFDEDLSNGFKNLLASYHVKNAEQVRALKAICILSHHSFNDQFKEILKQIYRMQISNTPLQIPLERLITNIIDEIPLPDEGKLLIQYEIGGSTTSFYRPIDQHPPYVDKLDIENLMKCLNIDNILEVFSAILLEKKILFISRHKPLLFQAINCFVSFIFPFQWKHTLIPVLPQNMIDILDAPFPFLIGMEPHPEIEEFDDLQKEAIIVELDHGLVKTPIDDLMQSQMPKMPFKEHKMLKHRLLKATECIQQIPDETMLKQCDLAFNMGFVDPDEEFIDHLEIKDAFLEFMSSVMSDYTKYLIDPSKNIENITCSKDFFDVHGFRFAKDAKKPYEFIYKLTETNHFSYFIESRCLGKSDRDNQIMQFDKLLSQKRTRMNPRLVHPFAPEKLVKALQPNEEGIDPNQQFKYKIFPKFESKLFLHPRKIPNYNQDSLQQQMFGQLISKEQIIKMHDNEWARYNLEVIYLLWFQIFCTTLPLYQVYSSNLIDFSRKLLQYIRKQIKPMRDIEFIYRRLFDACGSCKQINHLVEIFKDMNKNKIEADKVTSGTYFQALQQCKRRAGAKENDQDLRKSYFKHRMEDYHRKLHGHQDDDNCSRNSRQRESNITQDRISNYSPTKKPFKQASKERQVTGNDEEPDFSQFLQKRNSRVSESSNNQIRLSHILENVLYFEIPNECVKCKEKLREEEIITGFQKDLSSYTCKCPICNQMFVPKFKIYTESDNNFINGQSGETIQMLPPICLYKEYINIIAKESDQILMTDKFITKHKMVYWNIILYFKIIKLPHFMIDLDYSPFHQKVHCSQIMKYLPIEKQKSGMSFFGRQDSGVRARPPKLNSSALKQLNDQNQKTRSPFKYAPQGNFGGLNITNAIRNNLSITSTQSASKQKESDAPENRPSLLSVQRKNSMQKVKGMINMFSSKKSNAGDSQRGNDIPSNDKIQAIHFNNDSNQNNKTNSHAVENERKGFQNMMNLGVSNVINNFRKPSSQKSMGKGGSQRSGGAQSAITSLSDLEKIEKIMSEAQHADKNIVKYFGKYFEEFRRDMHCQKEIIFSEQFTKYGAGLQENNEVEVEIKQN